MDKNLVSSTVTLTPTQKVTASLNPTGNDGASLPVFNINWAIVANEDGSTGDCTLTPASDGMTCEVAAGTDNTTTKVVVTATTRQETDSNTLTDSGLVNVTSGGGTGEATSLGFTFGEPTEKSVVTAPASRRR